MKENSWSVHTIPNKNSLNAMVRYCTKYHEDMKTEQCDILCEIVEAEKNIRFENEKRIVPQYLLILFSVPDQCSIATIEGADINVGPCNNTTNLKTLFLFLRF